MRLALRRVLPLSAARALLVELAHLNRPADAGRCFTPSNRRHLELAEMLLAISPGRHRHHEAEAQS